MRRLEILVTGGTFDKNYDAISGKLSFGVTHVPEMLKTARCRLPIAVKRVMLKDSLKMTEADRVKVLRACRASKASGIVVTHGTDTLVRTAKLVGEAGLAKTVVFTGALVPYAFGSSDGFFNLGSALSLAQTLAPGVYVAMNGEIYDWDNVRKDRKLGAFFSRRQKGARRRA